MSRHYKEGEGWTDEHNHGGYGATDSQVVIALEAMIP